MTEVLTPEAGTPVESKEHGGAKRAVVLGLVNSVSVVTWTKVVIPVFLVPAVQAVYDWATSPLFQMNL